LKRNQNVGVSTQRTQSWKHFTSTKYTAVDIIAYTVMQKIGTCHITQPQPKMKFSHPNGELMVLTPNATLFRMWTGVQSNT
jgi:hypothetical protein